MASNELKGLVKSLTTHYSGSLKHNNVWWDANCTAENVIMWTIYDGSTASFLETHRNKLTELEASGEVVVRQRIDMNHWR